MAIHETIVTGRKFRKLIDETTMLWQRISFWTKASDVEFDDGSTLQDRITSLDTQVAQLDTQVAQLGTQVALLNAQIAKLGTQVTYSVNGTTLTITPES
ncbi:MAG: hypothetical protein NC079_00690 [Clostridium sp.]|nr:hypothetical protein [Acetatifactor muris]MCM1527446.1 hypothetical protein [Bacteroides sp.]MCM1562108.1 hypothetical protein [Clostridium sp.]